MNGYDLTRQWYRFASKNKRKVKPIHHALIHWIFERANQSEWAEEFQLKTGDACEMLGISDSHTYQKAFKDLVSFGAVKLIQEAVGIYSARWISIEGCEMYHVKNSHEPTHKEPHKSNHDIPHEPTHKDTTIIKPKETIKTTTETKPNFDDVEESSKKILEGMVDDFKESEKNREETNEATAIEEKIKIFRKLGGEMRTDQGLIETVCMSNKFDVHDFLSYLPIFIEEKIQEEAFSRSIGEAKRHFMNWVRIRHLSQAGKVIPLTQNQIPKEYRMPKY